MSSIVLHTIATICFVAGKSGGHLLPCITKANQILAAEKQTELYIFSTGSDLDKKIIDKHKNIKHYVPAKLWDVPYSKPLLMPFFIANTAWYFCKSLYKLWKTNPEKVISFGGFNSIPVCIAAKILRIPVEIYELNVEPGKATKLLSYFFKEIHICFTKTKEYFPNNVCTTFDYPVRFTNNDLLFNKSEFNKTYNFTSDKKTILILGGSQGSTLLNDVVTTCLIDSDQLKNNIQVIHQTGNDNAEKYIQLYNNNHIPAYVFGYHEKLQDFYNAADIIICRAGAGTLFEIKFFNKKCITIPHQTETTNHQILNALQLEQEYPDKFSIIKQSDFTKEALKEQLLTI